ncbi:MAG: hypothetical protein E4H01_14945 [Lysobacterales bacterium]|nr:MAG: hypothetical protein E4H01_14945 [Xanthomonadales bacterium]
MADNTQVLDPSAIINGVGDTIATDDIGGVKFQRVKMTLGADGVNDSDVSSANPMPVTTSSQNAVSTVNSTSTLLNAGATFTGIAEDASRFASVVVAVATDQVGTFAVQFSINGTDWDSTLTRYYRTDTIEPPHRFTITRKYLRVTFTNTSASNQTYLRLQTMFGDFADLNAPTDSTLAQDFDSVGVRPTERGMEVARGLVQGTEFNNKFGRNIATVTGDAIWATSNAYVEPASAELCNVTSTSIQDDNDAGTGAGAIIITGINELYDVVTETVLLNGTANVSTVNKYWNIHRAYVSAKAPTGTDAGAAGIITIISTAAGTPTMATLALGFNQTQSAIYMVPRFHTAYINMFELSCQSVTNNSTIDIGLYKKDFGGVWRIQNDALFREGEGTFQFKEFGAPLKWEGKSTILWKCVTASATFDVAVDYDIWLVRDRVDA